MALADWFIPTMIITCMMTINNQFRHQDSEKDIRDLEKHLHHRATTSDTTGPPVNKDGELLQPLDGIRGWY